MSMAPTETPNLKPFLSINNPAGIETGIKISGQTIDRRPTSDSVTLKIDVIIGVVIGAKFNQSSCEMNATIM